jgi:putative DNA primase/helicase
MQIVHLSQDKQPKIVKNVDNVFDIECGRFLNFPPDVAVAFRELKARFILWRGVHNPDGTVKKIPLSPSTGLAVDPTDTDHHVTFDDAFISAMVGPCAGKAWGIGIATGNGVAAIDIDHCREDDGSWSQIAVTVLSQFGNAYREVSQSGNGLHVICRVDELPRGYRNIPGGNPVEMYAENRFIALTGSGCSGSPVVECSEVFASVWDQYKPATKPKTTATQFDWEYDKPLPCYTSTATDQELLSLALSSRSAASVFGNKRSFNLIWSDGSNNSEDDASVIMSLFFYTGGIVNV